MTIGIKKFKYIISLSRQYSLEKPLVSLPVMSFFMHAADRLFFWCFLIGALLLTQSCESGNGLTFAPDLVKPLSEARLVVLADTSSYLPKIRQLSDPLGQIDSLLYAAEWLKHHDEDVALLYAQRALAIANEKRWEYPMGVGYYYVGLMKLIMDEWGEGADDGITDAKIGAKLFSDLKQDVWLIKAYNLIGSFQKKKGDLDSAQYYFQVALDRTEKVTLPPQQQLRLQGEIIHDLAVLYFRADSINLAIEYYLFGDSLYRQAEHKTAHTRLLFDYGNLYMSQGDFEKADSLLQLSLQYALEDQNPTNISDVYKKIGYLNLIRFYLGEKLESIAQQAIQAFRKSLATNNKNQFDAHNLMAQTYGLMNEYLPHHLSSLDSSIVYFKLAMEGARKEGAFSQLPGMVTNITEVCSLRQVLTGVDCRKFLGATATAFMNNNYTSILDTITATLQSANLRNGQFQRQQMEERNATRVRNQWLISGLILLFAALVFMVIVQQLQTKRLQARMEALRAQINPHFISNSLNAIESLVNMGKNDQASKYIIHFSRFSRRVLNRSREAMTTLDDELETLKHFLALEQLRFRDKLQFEIHVEEGINPARFEVPAMILQPYVENAIWHGLKPKTDVGFLQIKVRREARNLLCIIEDNGIGRAKSQEIQAGNLIKRKSLGMQITQERLHVLGQKQKAKSEIIDLYTETGEARGTRVLVRLPLKLRKSKEKGK